MALLSVLEVPLGGGPLQSTPYGHSVFFCGSRGSGDSYSYYKTCVIGICFSVPNFHFLCRENRMIRGLIIIKTVSDAFARTNTYRCQFSNCGTSTATGT